MRYWREDAIEAIDAIRSYIDGMMASDFDSDRKTASAVERELLLVAEVLARMPEFEEVYSDTHKVRGLGNRLRHDYERIDPRIIWDAISGPPLKELRDALAAFCPK
jgi:uncharacterized protein with HEPN domain